jgi:RNA polymerase-binding transcription factor DksA
MPPSSNKHPTGRPPGRRDALQVDPKWAWHYRTLVALRDHLAAERMKADTPPPPAGTAPAPAPVHSDEDFDREFIRALVAREQDALGEMNAAIERILHGRYGVDEATGRPIPPELLRARPWLRRLP